MTDKNDNSGRILTGGEPRVGIFWMIATSEGAQLLAASCPLSEAEAYGDCLTFGPGHYQVWQDWRCSRALSASARSVVREYEYEDWPRGRVVFDREQHRFVIYADRQLMGAAAVEQICARLNIPAARMLVQADAHYRCKEKIPEFSINSIPLGSTVPE